MTDADVLEISSLLHRRWAEACGVLDVVKAERDDGSADWDAFHQNRAILARLDEAMWRGVRDRFVAEHRVFLNRLYGL